MKHVTVGILAHVDAGKTTLAEAILYRTGAVRRCGRVDRGDTALDSHDLERRRGITIFAGQAEVSLGPWQISLLDTPGHVDFSGETERVLQVLDYAILVISGIDGVQAHTRTLWRLLAHYGVPTVLFLSKMDFARRSREDLLAELRRELDEGCADLTGPEGLEQAAMCREDLLEAYLARGTVPDGAVAELIAERQLFPCWFGSGLKQEGVDEFLAGLARYMAPPARKETFGARVFRIGHDGPGNRLTWLKVTGGVLRVKDAVQTGAGTEKINQIRLYTGGKYTAAEAVEAGGVCAVTGLSSSAPGDGLGAEETRRSAQLEPVMRYRVVLPPGEDRRTMLPRLRLLEEEDPLLRVRYDERLQEIQVHLMGQIQAEILRDVIRERFGVEADVDSGRVVYKETIENEVEGVGHYEPLRHYAEVHLLLRPLPRGSGLRFVSRCSEDALDRNWQRLILTHLAEKTHLGVLTGSPVTDMEIVLAAGRAHLKHTEGGDFRQATYRAVRQGLMQARSVLLEPWYAFRLTVPPAELGRAINDIRQRSGSVEPPREAEDGMSLLQGRAPVTALEGYAAEVAAYTGGRGRLQLEVDGYDLCHDARRVVEETGYDPERDVENTPDSVFCAHGGGFTVKWDRVSEYMHLDSCLQRPDAAPELKVRNLHLDERELEAIMLREFGPINRPLYTPPRATSAGEAEGPREIRQRWYIVDGYNLIFAWEETARLAREDLSAARDTLIRALSNFAGFTRCRVALVFDGYKVRRNPGEKTELHGLQVVYTRENETADMYIEHLVQEIGQNELVRIVTSDALIQLSAVRSGVLRTSAREFVLELEDVLGQIRQVLAAGGGSGSRVADSAVIIPARKAGEEADRGEEA